MCTVFLPPGDNTTAVNKYIVSYHYLRFRPKNKGHQRWSEANLSYSIRILVDTKGKITHSPWQNPFKETNLKQGDYITDLFPPLYHKVYQIFISYRSIRKIVCYHSQCLATTTSPLLLEAPDLRECWVYAGRDLERVLYWLFNKVWESWWCVENEQSRPWYSIVFFSL